MKSKIPSAAALLRHDARMLPAALTALGVVYGDIGTTSDHRITDTIPMVASGETVPAASAACLHP